jgi:hypothetical protein
MFALPYSVHFTHFSPVSTSDVSPSNYWLAILFPVKSNRATQSVLEVPTSIHQSQPYSYLSGTANRLLDWLGSAGVTESNKRPVSAEARHCTALVPERGRRAVQDDPKAYAPLADQLVREGGDLVPNSTKHYTTFLFNPRPLRDKYVTRGTLGRSMLSSHHRPVNGTKWLG